MSFHASSSVSDGTAVPLSRAIQGAIHPSCAIVGRRSFYVFHEGDAVMSTQLVSPLTSVQGGQTPRRDEFQEALSLCPHVARVDDSVLWVVSKIFDSARDRRVKKGGYLFLAYFLRLSTIDQLSLFPGTEKCDVAVVQVRRVIDLCKLPKDQWPWCYESTLKYLDLLVAAGVFERHHLGRGRGQAIHFPLRPYMLIPEGAEKRLSAMSTKRARVSASAAFTRVVQHCHTQPGSDVASPSSLQSSPCVPDFVAQEVEKSVLALVAALHNLRDSTGYEAQELQLLKQHLYQHTVRILHETKKGDSFEQDSVPSVGSRSTHTSLAGDSSAANRRVKAKNLTLASHPVDSSSSLIESSLIHTHPLQGNDESLNEDGGTSFVDSALTVDSLRTRCTWLIEFNSGGRDAVRETAQLLSEYFSGDETWARHYAKMLRANCGALHLAIVDALVRSSFPDPGHKPDQLGGGWITKRYKAYRGGEAPVPEIEAWAESPYDYVTIAKVLDTIAGVVPRDLGRPTPQDVVVQGEQLRDFWREDAALGLESRGISFVEVDGEVLLCAEYQHLRACALREELSHSSLANSEISYETETYLEWTRMQIPQQTDPQEVPSWIPRSLARLEAIVDSQVERVEHVCSPFGDSHAIVLSSLSDPALSRVLGSEQEVESLFAVWQQVLSGRVPGATPLQT